MKASLGLDTIAYDLTLAWSGWLNFRGYLELGFTRTVQRLGSNVSRDIGIDTSNVKP